MLEVFYRLGVGCPNKVLSRRVKMDQLPYELTRIIIEYVLVGNESPLCLQHCVRTRLEFRGKRAISMGDRSLSLQKLLYEEWTAEHRFTRPSLHNWP